MKKAVTNRVKAIEASNLAPKIYMPFDVCLFARLEAFCTMVGPMNTNLSLIYFLNLLIPIIGKEFEDSI